MPFYKDKISAQLFKVVGGPVTWTVIDEALLGIRAKAAKKISDNEITTLTDEEIFACLAYYTSETTLRQDAIDALFLDAFLREKNDRLGLLIELTPPQNIPYDKLFQAVFDAGLHADKDKFARLRDRLMKFRPLDIPIQTRDTLFERLCELDNKEDRLALLPLFKYEQLIGDRVYNSYPSRGTILDVMIQAIKKNNLELMGQLLDAKLHLRLSHEDLMTVLKTTLQTDAIADTDLKFALLKDLANAARHFPFETTQNVFEDIFDRKPEEAIPLLEAVKPIWKLDTVPNLEPYEMLHHMLFQKAILTGNKALLAYLNKELTLGIPDNRMADILALTKPSEIAFFWEIIKIAAQNNSQEREPILQQVSAGFLNQSPPANLLDSLQRTILENAIENNSDAMLVRILKGELTVPPFLMIAEEPLLNFFKDAVEKDDVDVHLIQTLAKLAEENHAAIFDVVAKTILAGTAPERLLPAFFDIMLKRKFEPPEAQLKTFLACYKKVKKDFPECFGENQVKMDAVAEALASALALAKDSHTSAKDAGHVFIDLLRKTASLTLDMQGDSEQAKKLKNNIAEIDSLHKRIYSDFKRSPLLSAAYDVLAAIASVTVVYGFYLFKEAVQKYKDTGNIRLFKVSTEQQSMNKIKEKLDDLKPKEPGGGGPKLKS